MTTTVFSAITAKLVTLMQAAPALSANVLRASPRAVAEQYTDAINVQFEFARPQPGAIHGAPIDWVSKFTLECYARSATTSGDQAVDPLFLAAYGRIFADTTLGGLVMDVNPPEVEAEYATEAQKTGLVRMTLDILHRTSNLTLEST